VTKGSRATKFSVAAVNRHYTVMTANYATSVQNFFCKYMVEFLFYSAIPKLADANPKPT